MNGKVYVRITEDRFIRFLSDCYSPVDAEGLYMGLSDSLRELYEEGLISRWQMRRALDRFAAEVSDMFPSAFLKS